MNSRIDLHIHSKASDGEYAPAEIVEMACSLGLEVIAITDHDTVGGIDEAMEAAQGSGLEVIPGVEINAESKDQSIHILGYYINHRNESLLAELTKLCHSREWRARRVLEELTALGMPLKWDRLLEIAEGSLIGRPHIAEAMVEQGYVSTISAAFDDCLGRGMPGYVQRPRLAPEAAIALILSVGGAPVLAHPLGMLHLLPELLRAGLAGLEAYYSGYSVEESRVIAAEAQRHGLITTGGSDYHGPSVSPGIELGQTLVPATVMGQLRTRYQALAGGE